MRLWKGEVVLSKEEIKAALHEYRQERKDEKTAKDFIGYISIEIIIISAILGLYFQSWGVFGGCFIGLLICYFIPYVGAVLSIVFSVLWAYLAWMLLGMISPTVGIIAGIIVFLISLGIHFFPRMD